MPFLILKSHVQGYTRADGVTVREHDDSRAAKVAAAPATRMPHDAKAVEKFSRQSFDLVGTHNSHVGSGNHARVAHAVASGQVKGEHMRQAVKLAHQHKLIDKGTHDKMQGYVDRAEREHAAGSSWMKRKPYTAADVAELDR